MSNRRSRLDEPIPYFATPALDVAARSAGPDCAVLVHFGPSLGGRPGRPDVQIVTFMTVARPAEVA